MSALAVEHHVASEVAPSLSVELASGRGRCDAVGGPSGPQGDAPERAGIQIVIHGGSRRSR